MSDHAAFVIALTPSGEWAATTRAADRGEAGRIGLPGGKLDPGELAMDAAIREAREEGWDIDPQSLSVVHYQYVDCRPVVWFVSSRPAVMRDDWAEQGRITPVAVTYDQLAGSGYGNNHAMPKARQKIRPITDYDV